MLLTVLGCFLNHSGLAASQPRGSLLELHSCELYAGGCVVSSEATLGGRYMLTAWNFADGCFQGTALKGLSLAVLQSSSDNLAAPGAEPGLAVVYLPKDADSSQRAALLAWLKSSQPGLAARGDFQARIVPIQFAKTETGYVFSAGAFVSVRTASLESCETGACGQALWYTPRTQNSVFTVAADRSSTVREPLLQLKWDDAGRKSIFLAKFGEAISAQNLYVSSSELCGPTARLF